VPRFSGRHKGQKANAYDFTGLIEAVPPYAEEAVRVRENRRKADGDRLQVVSAENNEADGELPGASAQGNLRDSGRVGVHPATSACMRTEHSPWPLRPRARKITLAEACQIRHNDED